MIHNDGASGFFHLRGFLTPSEIAGLIEAAAAISAIAPYERPSMLIGGRELAFRLTLTNAGTHGWWSDRDGFRYTPTQPMTGEPWPAIPPLVLDLGARALALSGLPPMRVDNLLINHYAEGESLGQHQDRTEEDLLAPIVSLSVGADALFLLGGPGRKDPVTRYILQSGDACIQSGASRGWFHGVKEVQATMGSPLPHGDRLNFTMRQVEMRAGCAP